MRSMINNIAILVHLCQKLVQFYILLIERYVHLSTEHFGHKVQSENPVQ